MRYYPYYLLALVIISLDQFVKYLVHTSMVPGEEIRILGDLFKLHYTTNPGMAFGVTLGGVYGKLFLTLFRLVAMVGIGFYLKNLFDKGAKKGLLITIAMILGGAVGNVIDSTIYGLLDESLLIDNAPSHWFYGKVIDMFYIDIASGYYPGWVPLVGGNYYSFWPIFNIADSSIFIAVGTILIYQKPFFAGLNNKEDNNLSKKENLSDEVFSSSELKKF